MERGRILGSEKHNKLAIKMRSGDEAAARELYNSLIEKVYGFCMNRVSNTKTAEDLSQEIFLKLVQYINAFDETKGDFLPWFWQLSRNILIDYFRSRKEISFSDIDDEKNIDAETEYSLDEQIDNKLKKEKLYSFIRTLSKEEQEIFKLRFVSEFSYKEMENVLDKSEISLRVATSRIKKKMKQYFINYA